MNNSYYIRQARIVNENRVFSGAILVRDGIIAEIFTGTAPDGFQIPDGMPVIDAGGKFLFPGLIDEHVHFREPGLTGKGDIHSESLAAVAGGVTSFMEMPNTKPNATTLEILEEKYRLASEKSLANYSFYLGAAHDNLPEIEKADPSRICGLKIFLGSSTGNMMVDDIPALEAIFQKSPLLICVHAEEEDMIRNNLRKFKEKYGDDIPVSAHPLIRSAEACFASSEKAVSLAGRFGARMHLLHLSTAREISLLRKDLPLAQKKITGEVCLNHLFFDDRDYPARGAAIKCNPAVKTPDDREALLAAVLNDTIDVIATDHAPHAKEEKEHPYASCPSGSPLVQHSLPAMMEFFLSGRMPVEKIVEKMCHNPAILFRIDRRGFIRKGYHADLVLVDPDDPWTVEKNNILYKCGWSPFEGTTFRSRVTRTWVNGHLAYDRGRFDESLKGMRLSFLI